MSGYKVDPLPKNLYMEYGNFYMELLNEEKKVWYTFEGNGLIDFFRDRA